MKIAVISLLMGVGLIFLVVSVCIMLSRKRKTAQCVEQTIGTVIELKSKTSFATSDDVATKMWHPVIEYSVDDKTFQNLSAFGSTKKRFAAGQKVTILYNPSIPEQYLIAEENGEKILSIVFAVVGCLILLCGGVLVFLLK